MHQAWVLKVSGGLRSKEWCRFAVWMPMWECSRQDKQTNRRTHSGIVCD